jgi:hypothetical protein
VSDCRFVRPLIEGYGLRELDPDLRESVVEHLAACQACGAAFVERTMAVDSIENALGKRGRRFPPNRRRLRLVGAAFGLAATFALGAWYAAPYIQAWRFPGGAAAPIIESQRLIGIDDPGFERAAVTGNQIGKWNVGGNEAPGFASVDDKIFHSGGHSLKLVQRSGSNGIWQTLNLNLPAGTEIIYGAWVYAPRGGSSDNKWLMMTMQTDTTPNAARLDYLAATPTWTPLILRTLLSKPATSLRLDISVGAGRGKYQGWDWATWIDDVFVGVEIPVMASPYWKRGGAMVVPCTLPSGYSLSDIDPKSISLERIDYEDLLPGALEDNAGHPQFVFGPEAVLRFSEPVVETGIPPNGVIFGRFNKGGYSIPFYVSVKGYIQDAPPSP